MGQGGNVMVPSGVKRKFGEMTLEIWKNGGREKWFFCEAGNFALCYNPSVFLSLAAFEIHTNLLPRSTILTALDPFPFP